MDSQWILLKWIESAIHFTEIVALFTSTVVTMQGGFVVVFSTGVSTSLSAFEDPEEVFFACSSWGLECGLSVYLAIEICSVQVAVAIFLKDHKSLSQYKDLSKIFKCPFITRKEMQIFIQEKWSLQCKFKEIQIKANLRCHLQLLNRKYLNMIIK